MPEEYSDNDKISLISQCMQRSLQQADPDDAIRAFIGEVGRIMHAHAIYVYTVESDRTYDRTFYWREDGQPARADMQTITEDDFVSQWWDAFHEGRMIIDTGMSKYKESQPHGYQRIQDAGIDSMVLCPTVLNGVVYGLVAFSNVAEEYLRGNKAIFEINVNYIAMMLRHRDNRGYINKVTNYDETTGLYNLAKFRESLGTFIQRVKFGQEPKAWDVVSFNISGFKVLNNELGFSAGNVILRTMGDVVRKAAGFARATRAEGDRFYCLLEDDQVEAVARHVHDAMKAGSPSVDVYVGIYTLTGDEAQPTDALDSAKMAGIYARSDFRRYYRRFEPQMAEREKLNVYITSNVDNAIRNGWIKVYYQPIYNATSKKIYSFEALSRWVDPTHGFLNPGQFIPVLENTHLLYKLDLHVLDQACQQIRRHADKGELFHVSVNVSRNDLDVPGFHQMINDTLARHGVSRKAVALEITESALVDHEEMIQQHIAEFHKDGYRVWLDDFGSGYSSLNALQRFDFDLMKIDMTFLRNPTDRTPAVLKDVVDMSKKLGILCLTEGVETAQQLQFLRNAGCSYMQGFYVSRPEPVDQIEQLLHQKGISKEAPADHDFYQEVSLANVMFKADPYIGKGYEPMEDSKIVAVVVEEGGRLHTAYTNETGVQWLHAWKATTPEDVNRLNNQSEVGAIAALRRGISKLTEKGQIAEEHFRDPYFPGKMRIQLITAQGSRRAFLVTAIKSDAEAVDFSFADLASGIPAAAFIYQAQGDEKILYANSACVDLFGCDSLTDFMDLVGGTFRGMVHPDDLDSVEKSIRRQLEGGTRPLRDYVTYRALTKDGRELVLLDVGELIHHRDYGDVFFVIIFDRDTQLKAWGSALEA